MPNRIIKESICTSESIASLSFFEECLFYRLIVNCDDYGRFDGRIAIIKSRLFPLYEKITSKMIEDGLQKLASANLIRLYTHFGKPYLYLPTWGDHQCIRNKRSKYPEPSADDNDLKANEIICKQMSPYSESLSVSKSVTESVSESNAHTREIPTDTRFEIFWEAYPRKDKRKESLKVFMSLHLTNDQFDEVMNGLRRQKKSRQWQTKQYIPTAPVWLRGERWNDELQEDEPKSKNPALGYGQKAISKEDFDAMVVDFNED